MLVNCRGRAGPGNVFSGERESDTRIAAHASCRLATNVASGSV